MSIITVVGNLTADPDQLRYAGETPVLNANLAENNRVKVNGQWQDGEPTFYRLNIWRQNAVNAAETLRKGLEVIVVGTQKTTAWTDREGQKRTNLEIDVDYIGPSLRFQTAQVAKVQKGQAQQGGGFGGGQAQQSGWGAQQPAADPWGGAAAGGGSWDTPGSSEPPF
ncbi:single-stranded DNA-binding protein [Nesterenkonia lacusekhoensis]|uniref:Single-stranded DNA-binding protein n=1 Tax=Nesterenkonia lacusekhoensis TaxID=150832 RepID=A0ABS4T551_9MICC|nr:single-stranded DNA-binding protein [Nesterenkonia lacusekhoensis]MBP2319594.1 single-strand DNA-binding protein [Nesterenkonia lacusekhoensis]